MKPNRCAWLPCRRILAEAIVPTLGNRQFCGNEHLKHFERTAEIARAQQEHPHDQLAFWPAAHKAGASA